MELTRVLLGIVVAVGLPLCVPPLRRAPRASIAFSALYALFTVLTAIPWYAAVIAVLGATGVQFLVHRDSPIKLPKPGTLRTADLLQRLRRPARPARGRTGTAAADDPTRPVPQVREHDEPVAAADGADDRVHGEAPRTDDRVHGEAPRTGDQGSPDEPPRPRGRHAGEERAQGPTVLDRLRPHAALIAAAVLLILLALLVEGGAAIQAAAAGVTDDRVAIAVSAFLLATFVGGAVVARLLAPFTATLAEQGEDMPALRGAGQYIGWFERALLFCFIVGGQPEAAVLVVAAKALARFPELKTHQKGFAEYSLVGTLASLTVALAVALLARAALGLSLL